MKAPGLLCGIGAIADYLGRSVQVTQHMHSMRDLPTFQVGGTAYATAAALDDWKALHAAGLYPTR